MLRLRRGIGQEVIEESASTFAPRQQEADRPALRSYGPGEYARAMKRTNRRAFGSPFGLSKRRHSDHRMRKRNWLIIK